MNRIYSKLGMFKSKQNLNRLTDGYTSTSLHTWRCKQNMNNHCYFRDLLPSLATSQDEPILKVSYWQCYTAPYLSSLSSRFRITYHEVSSHVQLSSLLRWTPWKQNWYEMVDKIFGILTLYFIEENLQFLKFSNLQLIGDNYKGIFY